LDGTALFLHIVAAEFPATKQQMLERLRRSDEALQRKEKKSWHVRKDGLTFSANVIITPVCDDRSATPDPKLSSTLDR